MSLLVVVPIITTTYADACIESIKRPDSAFGVPLEDILVVDNSREGWAAERYGLRTHRDPNGFNLGVARSWNIGVREVLERNLDYLIVMSVSMQFGPKLQTDWIEQMGRYPDATVIECDGHSWHLICFHRRVFEAVGLFDENLYPAYFEATDMAFRMRQVGMEGNTPEHPWARAWINARSQSVAGHIDDVHCPAPPLLAYMADKWGGPKGDEGYTRPWGDKPLDYWPEHSIPELAAKYELKTWW